MSIRRSCYTACFDTFVDRFRKICVLNDANRFAGEIRQSFSVTCFLDSASVHRHHAAVWADLFDRLDIDKCVQPEFQCLSNLFSTSRNHRPSCASQFFAASVRRSNRSVVLRSAGSIIPYSLYNTGDVQACSPVTLPYCFRSSEVHRVQYSVSCYRKPAFRGISGCPEGAYWSPARYRRALPAFFLSR